MSGMIAYSNSNPLLMEDVNIGVNIKNVRTQFDREPLEELAESIKNFGLMQPIVVMQGMDEDGNYITELVAGERRIRAIQLIQKDDPDFMSASEGGIPFVEFTGLLHDAKYMNAAENINREEVDSVDICAWIAGRLEEGVAAKEIAQCLKKTQGWVSQHKTVHYKTADEVKNALREKVISFSTAYKLAKEFTMEEQSKWLARQTKHLDKITAEMVDDTKVTSKKPTKKMRTAMLQRAEAVMDDKGSDAGRGTFFALRWIEGDIDNDDMEQFMSIEENA